MYILISKLEITGGMLESDRRELKALAERVRQKFKVKVLIDNSKGSDNTIVISTIGQNDHNLGQLLDQISDYIEVSGFGRVESEQTFLDDIDNLFVGEPS